MIEINNTHFSFGKREIIQNLNLKLSEGKCYGLLGLNGAGKTTLLKLICGGLIPKQGEVQLCGQPMSARSTKSYSNVYLVPEIVLLPNVTLGVFLKMNSPFYSHFDKELFLKMLEQLQVPTNLKLGNLSQGQQKKLAIAFGMATKTAWLLLDEPTNGLDIPSKQQFQRLLAQQINQDPGIIISTHQIQDIDGLIDQVLVLHNSNIGFNESIEKIETTYRFNSTTTEPSNALYQEKHGMAYHIIENNMSEEPKPVNLALLFNAIISNPSIFNSTEQ